MKKQKEMKCGIWGRLCSLLLLCMVVATLFSVNVYAQGTTKVTAGSAKIRKSASTDSGVVASVKSGDKLDVIAQTTDKDGYTWYKVYVNGNETGYIRADLVGDVTGSVEKETASDSSGNDSSESESGSTGSSSAEEESSSQQVLFVQVKETTAVSGKVIGGDSVNVRENPSVSAAVAGKANRDTQVTITGEALDTENKLWYQVNYDGVVGFIRSDFLEITQFAEEMVEETVVEETEEDVVEETTEEVFDEPVVNQDYEVIYEMNGEGVEEWFLYDYKRGTKQSLENLLSAVRQTQQDGDNAVSQLKTFKIVTIVMAGVILGLIIVVTVLIFKLRDSYEYEYEYEENDDDEDDDEYEGVGRRTTAIASNVVAAATQERRGTFERNAPVDRKTPVERKTSVEAAKPQKKEAPVSKNFLDIDDDMEFEFLDLK